MTSNVLAGLGTPVPELLRVGMFIAVGLVVGILRERILNTEQRLRETGDYLSSLIRHSNAPIVVWDKEGKITLFNPAFERLTGYRADKILGQSVEVLFPEERREQIFQKINKILDGRSRETVEIPVRCENGQIATCLWNSANIYAPDGKSLIATIAQGQDITERKQAEEIIERSHFELDQILETAADGIRIIDKDFNVVRVNTTLAKMAGLNKEDMLGKKCYEAFKGELCHTENCLLKRILSGENYIECEVEKERLDGSRIPCLVVSRPYRSPDGELIGIIDYLRDISELKRLNGELDSAKTYAENIIANFLDTLIVTNPDGTIRTINQATLDLLEYKEEELIGKPVGMIFAEEEEEEEVKPFFTGTLEDLARRGVLRNYELTYVTKSGRRIPMSFNASVMRDKNGEILGVVAGAKDISKIKETEEQLRQAQKMEAVGQLAGGVAHDFNNILTAIQGYIDLALLNVQKDDRVYQGLIEIRKAGMRAANLTRQLLLFSRRQPMEMTPLDLNQVIQDLGKMLNRLIGEDISLSTTLATEPCTVRGDPGSIEHVIMNLVVNARDAMPDGGKIFVRTENVAVDEKYCKTYRYARPGEFICLSVQDTGVGMDQTIINRIFEPFFTTKGRGKGTGMGLSVVYGIVKQHKGWINVESSPGKGTTFRVYLPVVSMKPGQGQQSPVSLKKLRGMGERILLVEDDKSVRELTEEMLSGNGYKVYAAANAREAMDIFGKKGGDFDLIFCDVILPDERGPRLANQFLKIKPGIGILFASGYTDDKSDWRAIREGGHLFLQKPYSLSDLLKGVRETLKKSGL
ncbi:MAG: PAS domain S-box protein [Deltaproteobacteria bacterium]|nr:PAS domain S-box protein [Deltaproteobacteria bacterium]